MGPTLRLAQRLSCGLAPPVAWPPCCPSVASCPSFSSSPFLQPDGCPDLCNGNGRCTLGQNSWQCVCQTGWRGPGCNVAMETSCADNKDNEGGEQASSNSQPLKNRALYICGRHESFFLKDLPYSIVKCCCDISFEANAASLGQWELLEVAISWKLWGLMLALDSQCLSPQKDS